MTSDNNNSRDAVALERALHAGEWAGLERHLSSKSISETSAWLLGLDDLDRREVLSQLASRERASGEAESSEPGFLHLPYLTMIWKRLGWLVVLMIGQMFTATVLDYFDEQLERALVLALFIPMIISSGGNSGSQTLTPAPTSSISLTARLSRATLRAYLSPSPSRAFAHRQIAVDSVLVLSSALLSRTGARSLARRQGPFQRC